MAASKPVSDYSASLHDVNVIASSDTDISGVAASSSYSAIAPEHVTNLPVKPSVSLPPLHVINVLGKTPVHTWDKISQYIAHKASHPESSALLTIHMNDYVKHQRVLSAFTDVTTSGHTSSMLPYKVLRDYPHTQHPCAVLNAAPTHTLDLKFIINVNVGGVKTLAILDSASSLSYVDKELTQSPKIQLKPKSDLGAVITASGDPLPIKGTLSTYWRITNTGFSIPSETFNVIDIPYKGIGMILGQDLHTKYNIDLLNSTNSVNIQYRGRGYPISSDLLVPSSVAAQSFKTHHSQPYENAKQLKKDLRKGGKIILVLPSDLRGAEPHGTATDPPGSTPNHMGTGVHFTVLSAAPSTSPSPSENILLTTSPDGIDLTDAELKDYVSKLPESIGKVIIKHRQVFKKKLPPGLGSKYKKLREANKVVIPTTTDEPVFAKRRRLSPKETDELRSQMEDHLSRQIVRDSQSPYNAPLVFVQKTDGTIRMCVDYTLLNKVTVRHRGPLPNIQDLIDMLQGKGYFSSIDLVNGYRQILLSDADIPKTAFSTPWGHYEALVLWEGLCNAPAIFQGVMNDVFKPFLGRYVLIYLDDILVFSSTLEEHAQHLDQVLTTLADNSLFAKLAKSEFCKDHLKWLGHIITKDGVSMDPSKIQKIVDWPTPKSAKELQSFIGLCGFFSKFIPNYATLLAPLDPLRSYSAPWTETHPWGPQHEKAFRDLKAAMTSAQCLAYPNPAEEYSVYCDASLYGVGAILVQKGKPVAFYSKKFTKEQINYSTYEQEFTAVVHALRVWRCYLEGVKFTLYTDHQPLVYYNNQPQLSRRQARWLNTIASFDFEWKHIKGVLNPADPLSRYPGFDQDKTLNAAITHKVSVLCTLAASTRSGAKFAPQLEAWIQEHRPDLQKHATLETAKRSLAEHSPSETPMDTDSDDESPPAAISKKVRFVDELDAIRHTPSHPTAPPTVLPKTVSETRPVPADSPESVHPLPSEHVQKQDASKSPLGDDEYLPDDITGEEKLSPFITQLLKGYSSDPWFKNSKNLTGLFKGENDLWYRQPKASETNPHPKPQLVIPNDPSLRKQILEESHNPVIAGHPGVQAMYQNLLRSFWWPYMYPDVEHFVSHCPTCQMHKPLPYTQGKLTPLQIPQARWESISIDLITDLPRTLKGHDSILTVVDRMSKMSHFIPTVKTCTAETVAQLLMDHVFTKHGLPRSIISDRDPRFATSKFSQQLWKLTGTQLCTSTSYHPQSDGQTERFNRIIEQTLRMYVQPHGRDWDKILPMCEFAVNNNHHTSIGTTPFYLNYGYHPKTPLSLSLPAGPPGPASSFLTELQSLQKSATLALTRAQQRMKNYVDKHRKDITFATGQKVLLKTANLNLKGPRKFLPRYIGPFTIVKMCGPVACKLSLPESWRVHPVFHVCNLRLYKQSPGTPTPEVPENLSDSYLVHSITGHDFVKLGRRLFLRLKVHYVGKGIPDSLEFEKDLLPDYKELVHQYKKTHGLTV